MQPHPESIHHQASVRAALFSATTNLHQQLDSHPAIQRLLKQTLTHTEHLAVLAKFYRAYCNIEVKIIAFEKNNFQQKIPKYTPRLMALHNDLAAQTCHKENKFNSNTVTDSTDKQLSLAQYWGARYVLDGSCHGASMLLPKLSNYYKNNDTKPLAYWTLLAGLNKDWPKVCQQIEAIGSCSKALDEMIIMARSVFTEFIES